VRVGDGDEACPVYTNGALQVGSACKHLVEPLMAVAGTRDKARGDSKVERRQARYV
jgi:hypothetical protein